MNNEIREIREALVIKSTGSWYTLCDSLTSEYLEARLSGRIRLQGRRSTNPVVVGDRVDYYVEPSAGSSVPVLSCSTGSSDSSTRRVRRHARTAEGSRKSSRHADVGSDSSFLCSADQGRSEQQAVHSEIKGPALSSGRASVTSENPPLTGIITHIHERRNYIIRRSSNLSRESHIIAANLDQAFLVTTLVSPETSFEFIDRFLVTAEAYHVPTTLILNKTDLYDTPELQERRVRFRETYTGAGYSMIEVAAASGQGIDLLRERLRGRISLLSGHSGVGKSTLIRAVDSTLHPRIGAISDYHHRGRHTTTFSEMYALAEGGWLIDTPGIKGFGLIDLSGEEVGRYFPDLFRWAPCCGYYNCTHTHEPNCAVKEAVERGEISSTRYISYLKLLEEDEKYRQ